MQNLKDKNIAIGVPCYHAHSTLFTLLSSIQIQSKKDKCIIFLANDDPEDNGTYEKYKDLFKELTIITIDCTKNGGPGVARQRAFEEAHKYKCQWITYIDADDVFFNMFSLENLINGITPNCIEVMGTFFQEVLEGDLNATDKMQIIQDGGQVPPRLVPIKEVGHPWVFGRLYNIPFLKQNNINFSNLRAIN